MKRLKIIIRKIGNYIDTRRAYKFYIKQWLDLIDLQGVSQVINSMRSSKIIDPVEIKHPKGKSIVVIAPHPDDELIGPGGTLLKSASNGSKINIIYLTSDNDSEAIMTREKEAKEAVEALNCSVKFLRWGVKKIPSDKDSLEVLSDAIKSYSPDTIMVTFCLDDHDDHRRASELIMLLYSNNLISDNIEIWAYQIYSAILANVVVDITKFKKEKESCIEKYYSQYRSRNWAHYSLGLNAWNCRFLKGRGSEKVYAELFLVLPIKEYSELCSEYFNSSNGNYYELSYKSSSMVK